MSNDGVIPISVIDHVIISMNCMLIKSLFIFHVHCFCVNLSTSDSTQYNALHVVCCTPQDLPVNSHWQTPGRTPSVHFSMASRPSCPSSERSPSDSVSPTYERFVSCEEVFSSSVTPLQSQPQVSVVETMLYVH